MTHTIRLIRLKFIDTADDEQTWMLNVKKQWEGNSKIAVRVMCGDRMVGVTPPKMLQYYPFTGLSWETEYAMGATFPVDFGTESPNVLFEVVGLAKPPGTVLGLVFWSADSFIGSGIQYSRQTLHVFRTGNVIKSRSDVATVHAVIDVEVQAVSPVSSPVKPSPTLKPTPSDAATSSSQTTGGAAAAAAAAAGSPLSALSGSSSTGPRQTSSGTTAKVTVDVSPISATSSTTERQPRVVSTTANHAEDDNNNNTTTDVIHDSMANSDGVVTSITGGPADSVGADANASATAVAADETTTTSASSSPISQRHASPPALKLSLERPEEETEGNAAEADSSGSPSSANNNNTHVDPTAGTTATSSSNDTVVENGSENKDTDYGGANGGDEPMMPLESPRFPIPPPITDRKTLRMSYAAAAAAAASVSVSSPKTNSMMGSSASPAFPAATAGKFRGASVSGGGGGAGNMPPASASTSASQLHANAHLNTDMPLPYTFGLVRTSVLDLYFPNNLLSDGTTIVSSTGAAVAAAVYNSNNGTNGDGSPKNVRSPKTQAAAVTVSQASLGGSIIVSNVICVANMSEKVNLSMQLVARGAGISTDPSAAISNALIFNPSGGVIVLPNQRAFFSVTWNSDKPLSPHFVEDVQLLLSGPDVSPAPVTFRVHFAVPKNNELYSPYHYWANGTLITNRPLNIHKELPFIRSVLPVFLLQQQLGMGGGGGVGGSHGGQSMFTRASNEFATILGSIVEGGLEAGDEWLMVRDADTGLQRRVVSSGAIGPALLPDNHRMSTSNSSAMLGVCSTATSPTLGHASRSHQRGGSSTSGGGGGGITPRLGTNVTNGSLNFASQQLKMLSIKSWRSEAARCVLKLGTLQGFPMMTSSSTREGAAPSFKILAQSLSKKWIIEGDGETQEVYQTISGNLRWSSDDYLVLQKAPDAPLSQFLRLTLIECNAVDRDETPIAAAIISLGTDTASTLQDVPVMVAFYVYDTFSLYDQLPTSSLLMRGTGMKFAHYQPPAAPTSPSQQGKTPTL